MAARAGQRKSRGKLFSLCPAKSSYVLERFPINLQDIRPVSYTHLDVYKRQTIDSLPEAERPTQLPPLNKMLCDTVKMVAYRAETAMVALLRRHLKKEDDARALIRELFVSSADIEPNALANTLTIKIHRMASPAHDRAIAALLEELTLQDFPHPETGARMTFTLV